MEVRKGRGVEVKGELSRMSNACVCFVGCILEFFYGFSREYGSATIVITLGGYAILNSDIANSHG